LPFRQEYVNFKASAFRRAIYAVLIEKGGLGLMNKSKLYLVFALCVLATVVAYLTVSGNAGYTAGYSTDEEKADFCQRQ
jgi:hypothetical protein